MSTLGEAETRAVTAALATIEQDVAVHLELGPTATPVTLLAAGGRELDTGALTRDVVETVCALSARVTLEVTEHEVPGDWPCTTIGPGLRYLGMPVGYELTTLVNGIVEAGREESSLSLASLELLATLDRDVSLDVYVTPT